MTQLALGQAADYLESVNGINPRDMSPAMFRFVRRAARRFLRECTADGYYGGEYDGVRAMPETFVMWPAFGGDVIPQSPKLKAMTAALVPDPVRDAFWNLAQSA